MKKLIKWKTLIITCLICLLPILLGVALWDKLPDSVAIHFSVNNVPDNYASKGFAVFGLPFLMLLLQAFCCIVSDLKSSKYGEQKKLENVIKWIVPILAFILQCITFAYALEMTTEIRKPVMIIAGLIFIATGNYLPKVGYLNDKKVSSGTARKINRFIGFESVIMGVLAIITIFFPPIISIIWLFLLIPFGISTISYSAIMVKRDKL